MWIIRRPHEERNAQNKISESRITGLEKSLLLLVICGSALLPFLHLLFGIFAFANFEAPLFLSTAGIGFTYLGLWLFYRSHADLGRNWSVTLEVHEEHNLIDSGVYRRIRHPMYSAIFLLTIAQGLLLQNWLAGWMGFISFLILYLGRVRKEEAMMRDLFGEAYAKYCARTGRVFPKLKG